MKDNTPSTEAVRNVYIKFGALTKYQADRDEEDFNRWLEQVKADAVETYLRDWATSLGPHSLYSKWDIRTMIRNRIQELRKQEEA